MARFSRDETSYAAMGRFGNVMLISGEVDPALMARRGEVVRLFLTNTANTRVFNVAIPGARMKLVGGDSGRVEHEQFVESVIIAPSERTIVDVLFEKPGRLTLEHHTPARTYALASIDVQDEPATPSLAEAFGSLRHNAEWALSASGWRRTSTRLRTRHSRSLPRWTWPRRKGLSSTRARCTPRSSAPIQGAVQSAE